MDGTIQALLAVLGLGVHLFVCSIGARWGGERGRVWEGFFLALFFSVFGLIAIACTKGGADPDANRIIDAVRSLDKRIADLLAEMREQGQTQNAIATSGLASAKLLGIIAKGTESGDAE